MDEGRHNWISKIWRAGMNKLGGVGIDLCLHGSISGKSDIIVMNKPGSDSVG